MSELGRGIDKLELDVFQSRTGGLGEQRLTQRNHSLLGPGAAPLDHHVILLDFTVVREPTHGGDVLLGHIKVSGGVVRGIPLHPNAVHLLVHFSAVVHTHGTRASNSPSHAGRMPSTDASNLTETTMGLARKARHAPTGYHTLGTSPLGDGNGVNHLGLGEHGVHRNGLLQQSRGEIYLVSNRPTVDLDLHDVGLLLGHRSLGDLRVGDDTYDGAVLLDLLKLGLDFLAAIAVLLGVLGEGLLLGLVPVLVEATLDFLGEMLGPDSGERAETAGGFDVANHTDDNHGRGLDDGDGLGDLLLVGLGAGLLDVTHDVGHAGLVAHEGSEMRLLGGVIAGEGLNFALAALAALLGQEAQRAVAGMLKLWGLTERGGGEEK